MAINMSKIFIDDQLYDKQWFWSLDSTFRDLWFFLILKSDNAGLLDKNMPKINFYLKGNFTEKDILEFTNKVQVVDSDTKFWIPSKVVFQQGLETSKTHQLTKSPIHIGILQKLKKANCLTLWDEYLKTLFRDSQPIPMGDINSNSKSNGKSKRARGIQDVKVEEFELEYPNVDVKHEYKRWRNWLKANGKTYIDYVAAFTNWVSTSYVKKKEDTKSKVYTFSCRDCDEVQTAETKDLFYMCKCNKKLKILN